VTKQVNGINGLVQLPTKKAQNPSTMVAGSRLGLILSMPKQKPRIPIIKLIVINN